jgi:hypothetical protein
VEVNGKPHLIVPYSLATNDTKFVRGGMSTAEHFFTFLKDSLEVLLAEGERWPKMLSIGLHPRIVGHPGRIRVSIGMEWGPRIGGGKPGHEAGQQRRAAHRTLFHRAAHAPPRCKP